MPDLDPAKDKEIELNFDLQLRFRMPAGFDAKTFDFKAFADHVMEEIESGMSVGRNPDFGRFEPVGVDTTFEQVNWVRNW